MIPGRFLARNLLKFNVPKMLDHWIRAYVVSFICTLIMFTKS